MSWTLFIKYINKKKGKNANLINYRNPQNKWKNIQIEMAYFQLEMKSENALISGRKALCGNG